MMNCYIRQPLLALILLIAGESILCAQATAERLENDLSRAGCLFHSYEFNDITDIKPPKGYKPFYISHYGRHGSRYHTDDRYFGNAVRALQHADSIGNLTDEGTLLKKQIDSLCKVHDGMWGMLTEKGVREQKMLALRMYERFPEVFDGRHRSVLDTYSSDIPRCIMSLASFSGSLIACNPELDVRYETGARCSEYLRCGTAAVPIKKHYEPDMHKSIDDRCDWSGLLKKIFIKPSQMNCSAYDFASGLWGAWAICQCIEDVNIDILKYFDKEQLLNTWKYRSQYYHLIFVRSDLFPDVAIKGVKALLKDIVEKADEALSQEKVAATIRFGHDSTLMPLAGLVGIEGFDRVHSDSSPITDEWDLGTHVCMGSSLQLIFYRNRAGKILVKILYNEQEKRIPFLTPYADGVYYEWETLRQYFNK